MPYKMTNGQWRGHKMIDGKRKTKVFPSKSDAKKWEANLHPEDVNPVQTHTALSLATEYLDHCRAEMSADTYAEKKLAFRNLFRFVDPATSYPAIQSKQVFDALAHRAKGSGNAANKDRKNLLAWAAWVERVHRFAQPKAFSLPKWKEDRHPRHIPTEAEFWKAYNAAGHEDQVFLLAALHTAARRGELFRLLWSDVDFLAGTIRLGTRKTKSGGLEYSTLPMTSELSDALRSIQTRPRSMYVFSQEDGQPYTNRQHYMGSLCRRAGVPKFGFHSVRHLSASILARANVPIPTIQAILRHKSATTTARYLHSLGIVENVLEDVFCPNRKAPEFAPSEAMKK